MKYLYRAAHVKVSVHFDMNSISEFS